MPLAHTPHAPLNLAHPEPIGACDRCSFLYPLADLVFQKQWAGPSIVTLGLRCCPRCLDGLQENGFRTIIIGPDPKPLKDARPARYPPQAVDPRQLILDDEDADELDVGNTMRQGSLAFRLDDPFAGDLDVDTLTSDTLLLDDLVRGELDVDTLE